MADQEAADGPGPAGVPAAAGGPQRRPTLATVARLLGVSPATVSNAYNRPDQLSADLRERVLAAAAEIGYPGPHPGARGLRRGRVGALGVVLTERLSYAFSDPAGVIFLDGLSSVVEREGFALLLLPATGEAGVQAEAVAAAVVDGLVAYSLPRHDPVLDVVRQRGLPLVTVDAPAAPGAASVTVDDAAGAAAVARHLAELGHRSVGIVAFRLAAHAEAGWVDDGSGRGRDFPVAASRIAGYRRGLLAGAASARRATLSIFACAHNSQHDGWLAARALLARTPRPTALVAMSDELALGALAAAADLGLSVPGEVSVVGYDDTPAAARAAPPLTTVRQPLRRKGELAGEALLALLAGRPAVRRRLHTELVLRSSSGPPPPG